MRNMLSFGQDIMEEADCLKQQVTALYSVGISVNNLNGSNIYRHIMGIMHPVSFGWSGQNSH